MKNCLKISTYLLAFSFFLSCKSTAQEKTSDSYLAKMIQLTNVLDSIVGQEDSLNCDKFTAKINTLAENLFKDDSLLHMVTVELHDGDNYLNACGGGYAKFWQFPKEGFQCKCDWTQSKQFDTKIFGQCFFERKEGRIPPLIKNGIEYDHFLKLSLRSEKKFKLKYSPVVSLQVFMPVGGAY